MYKLKALAVYINGVTYKLNPKNPMMFDTSKGGKVERLKDQVEAATKGGFLEEVKHKKEKK